MLGRSSTWRVAMAGVASLTLTGACTTGQYSYVSETEAGRRAAAERAERVDPSQADTPWLLVVGGNALLPGVRETSAGVVPVPTSAPGQVAGGYDPFGPLPGAAAPALLSLGGGASPLAPAGGLGVGLSVAGAAAVLQVQLTNSSTSGGSPPVVVGGGSPPVVVGGGTPPPPSPLPVAVPGVTPIVTLISHLPLPAGLAGH